MNISLIEISNSVLAGRRLKTYVEPGRRSLRSVGQYLVNEIERCTFFKKALIVYEHIPFSSSRIHMEVVVVALIDFITCVAGN